MSAFVYQYLKCCGLKPELKVGYNLQEGYGHAWVICQGKIIESTWLQENKNKTFYSKITPCELTEDAKDIEFDWWNSQYIKNKMINYNMNTSAPNLCLDTIFDFIKSEILGFLKYKKCKNI